MPEEMMPAKKYALKKFLQKFHNSRFTKDINWERNKVNFQFSCQIYPAMLKNTLFVTNSLRFLEELIKYSFIEATL